MLFRKSKNRRKFPANHKWTVVEFNSQILYWAKHNLKGQSKNGVKYTARSYHARGIYSLKFWLHFFFFNLLLRLRYQIEFSPFRRKGATVSTSAHSLLIPFPFELIPSANHSTLILTARRRGSVCVCVCECVWLCVLCGCALDCINFKIWRQSPYHINIYSYKRNHDQ